MKTAILIFGGYLAFSWVVLGHGAGESQDQKAILATKTKHAIDLNDSPSDALAKILWQTGVPGGVIQIEKCSAQTKIHLRIPEGTSIETTLQELVKLNPDYKWEVQRGVVNLLPASGVPDLLKARVAKYDSDSAVNKFAPSAVLDEMLTLPNIQARAAQLRLKPGVQSGGPGVACDTDCKQQQTPGVRVKIKDASLLEAFNSTVASYGQTIWTYVETECNGKRTYLIDAHPD
jgi:hypothetical protein